MKKLFIVLISLTFLFSFISCDPNNEEAKRSPKANLDVKEGELSKLDQNDISNNYEELYASLSLTRNLSYKLDAVAKELTNNFSSVEDGTLSDGVTVKINEGKDAFDLILENYSKEDPDGLNISGKKATITFVSNNNSYKIKNATFEDFSLTEDSKTFIFNGLIEFNQDGDVANGSSFTINDIEFNKAKYTNYFSLIGRIVFTEQIVIDIIYNFDGTLENTEITISNNPDAEYKGEENLTGILTKTDSTFTFIGKASSPEFYDGELELRARYKMHDEDADVPFEFTFDKVKYADLEFSSALISSLNQFYAKNYFN